MDIKQKAFKGVRWNTIAMAYSTIIQIVRLAILTSILDKSDFGLIAIAMMVISFTEIFSELGLTVGIIHKQDITQNQYSSLFWLNLILSVIIFFIIWALAPLVARYYEEKVLESLIPLLGVQVLFNSIGKMFQTVQTKKMEFKYISLVKVVTVTIGFIATIILAIKGYGVYSLAIGQLIQIGLTQILFCIKGFSSIRISFHFNILEIVDFVKIGSYRLGSQILDFISSKIDIFLIGKFFSMEELGIYNIAKELISRPNSLINAMIDGIGSSAFAYIQNDIDTVSLYYKRVVSIISSISIPLYAALFVFAEAVVAILYAPSFSDVAIFLQILAVIGPINAINGQAGTLQVALGRTDIGFKWTIIRVILFTVIILALSSTTLRIVALGQSVMTVLCFFLYWRIVIFPLSRIKLIHYISIFKSPLLATFIIAGFFYLVVVYFHPAIWIQVLLGILYSSLYVAYLYKYNRDVLTPVIKLINFKKNI